ncbi:hypothetical protein SAMN05216178_3999 [Pseudomonas saponiphila]|uniref:Uncharacterized protein n=1 Tax=Pseudomonas saponiphila TaxID=556534 RepID=A0A1H4R1B1_9PSED|nr:hypothetical protein [Pseudomonas saponiphila]SEC25645.1 hypothetical protein SAMN05216178_3999 [Pseudomonas saponiphila]
MTQIAQITGGASRPSRGWLKPMFPITGKAHYYSQDKAYPAITSHGRAYFWRSLCGIDAVSTDKMPMFEPGNWDRCKKCEQKLSRRSAA